MFNYNKTPTYTYYDKPTISNDRPSPSNSTNTEITEETQYERALFTVFVQNFDNDTFQLDFKKSLNLLRDLNLLPKKLSILNELKTIFDNITNSHNHQKKNSGITYTLVEKWLINSIALISKAEHKTKSWKMASAPTERHKLREALQNYSKRNSSPFGMRKNSNIDMMLKSIDLDLHDDELILIHNRFFKNNNFVLENFFLKGNIFGELKIWINLGENLGFLPKLLAKKEIILLLAIAADYANIKLHEINSAVLRKKSLKEKILNVKKKITTERNRSKSSSRRDNSARLNSVSRTEINHKNPYKGSEKKISNYVFMKLFLSLVFLSIQKNLNKKSLLKLNSDIFSSKQIKTFIEFLMKNFVIYAGKTLSKSSNEYKEIIEKTKDYKILLLKENYYESRIK